MTGQWWVSSDADSRWQGEGDAPTVGWALMAIEKFVAERTQELGGAPPDDLSFGWSRDGKR